ncbi:MAG: CHAT domain-containing protein [Winogradskyella sp.]|uniref:CHAT domain-containing protein n=1 Tax=Winogradskyella sp. TaxID=1883156 RepID=UPI000F3E4253|nr:CHAT domain-containing tetratricopeptide repeat protein [Winogradskyella sp.]RNC86799.1 MAG: CHAT domain-containing protein [Winogradskyella sp.]
MKRILILAILLLPNGIMGQSCDLNATFSTIDSLNAKGVFKPAIALTDKLSECPNLSNEQQIAVYVKLYKLQRNRLKNQRAQRAIQKAKALIDKYQIPMSLDIKLCLAESYAATRDLSNYKSIIAEIETEVLNNQNSDSLDLGRYYMCQYRATDKGSNTHEAINYLQKALAVLNDHPTFYKSQTLRGLGNMNRILGDFDKSVGYYKRELELYNKFYDSNHFDVAATNYNLGNIYYEKLEYQQALNHYLVTQPIWTKIYKPDARYLRYLNEAIGDMYWELGDHENALIYFDKSTTNEKLVNNDESQKSIIQGDSLLTKGKYNAALGYYEDAFKWREKTFGPEHTLTGACKNFVARAKESSGDIQGALTNYQAAIDILVKDMENTSWYDNPTMDMSIQSNQYLLESLSAKGQLLKQLYKQSSDLKDLEASFYTYEAAINVLEQMKDAQISESSRLYWSERTIALIENAIDVASILYSTTSNNDYIESAFDFSERSKALLLLTAMQGQSITGFGNVPNIILENERDLKANINELTGKIEREEKRCSQVREKMMTLWKNKLEESQNAYDILRNRIKNEHPEYYNLKHSLKVVGIKQLQNQLLNDDTILLSYFSGLEQTYVFAVTRNTISLRTLGSSEALSKSASSLFQHISNSKQRYSNQTTVDYLNYTRNAHSLYKQLIAPELSNIENKTRLIIIPDGILAYLPFEILITKAINPKEKNYKTLDYLIKNYAISYSPSASISLLSHNSAVAYGDYKGFAPDYRNSDYGNTRNTLSSLSFNAEEVSYGANLFSGQSWTGQSVTETTLKNDASNAGILHLAMHGEVEDEHPLLSKLYLNGSDTNDGMLHTYEIYNMNIPSQLVILSACNTATGKLVRGEGILSLERAFQYAGSTSLLSTLWSVDDATSSQLTQLFLKKLKNGLPKDLALQEAKLEFLETTSPEYTDPFYWSSYKLTGSYKSYQAGNTSYLLYIGLSILILGVVGFYIFNFLRKKPSL